MSQQPADPRSGETPVTLIAISLAFLATFGTATASAQPQAEEAAILGVVDRFMTAVSTNDSTGMAQLHLDGAIHIGVSTGAAGATVVNRRGLAPPPADAKPTVSVRRERYWDPVVHIRGSIAIVWTPYEFWRDGKTTHCGVDVFNLVKQDGLWRIANMMWTVEPEACAQLRPSDPARVRPPA